MLHSTPLSARAWVRNAKGCVGGGPWGFIADVVECEVDVASKDRTCVIDALTVCRRERKKRLVDALGEVGKNRCPSRRATERGRGGALDDRCRFHAKIYDCKRGSMVCAAILWLSPSCARKVPLLRALSLQVWVVRSALAIVPWSNGENGSVWCGR